MVDYVCNVLARDVFVNDPLKLPPFEQRFVKCCFKSITHGALNLDLQDDPAKGARILYEELPEGTTPEDFVGQKDIEVFLLEPTPKNPDLWFGSIIWGQHSNNPWNCSPPHQGDEVTGVVKHYVEDFAVMVRLSSGLSAFLHRGSLPVSQHSNIRDTIYVGDNIAAIISNVDKKKLHITLSVVALVTQRKHQLSLACDNANWDDDQDAPIQAHSLDVFSAYKILLMDDDQRFTLALGNWLRTLGAEVQTAETETAFKTHLRRTQFSHILIDFNVGKNNFSSILQQIKQHGNDAQTAIISGSVSAQPEAERLKIPILVKPLDHQALQQWITTGIVPKITKNEQHNLHLWQKNYAMGQIIHSGEQLLAEVCEDAEIQAALWVKQERDGVFTIRFQYGIEKNLALIENRLHHTAIANAIETGAEKSIKTVSSGPLSEIAPDGCTDILVYPIKIKDTEKPIRSIAFFNNSIFSEACKRRISLRQSQMESIVERITLARHLEEVESFATLGRITAGIVHDIRGALAPLITGIETIEKTIVGHDVLPAKEVLKKQVSTLRQQARSVDRLARTNLGRIQEERVDRIAVNTMIKQIVDMMRIQAREAHHKNHSLQFKLVFPKENIIVHLPPQVLEQPLINLLDNAIHHIGTEKHGLIEVIVHVQPENSETPLQIKVRDNGPGINAEQASSLFSPRITSKGNEGFGMGLYISRNLLKSVGGNLDLAETYRWLGSTFIICLPLVLKG